MNSTSRSAATSGVVRRKRFWGALAVTALLSAVMVVSSQPTSADATKTVTASCFSPDPDTQALLDSFGSLTAPLTINTTAPPFVEPGQTGVDVAVSWSLSLPANVVDIIAGITPTLTISNAQIDTIVEGPTSTTKIPGAPPAQTINLTPGQPFNSQFPPFTGQLNDIGSGGIIKLKTDKIKFLITLAAGPISQIDLECTTNATVASIPIKVAGSPDIVQPIQIATSEGQSNTIDVLGEYVTNGFTKDGVEQQVDPSTLKIVEGDATIQGGKIVANGPAAGTSADVTFEVCAGTIVLSEADPGVSEVQTLRIYEDPAGFFGVQTPGVEYRRLLGAQFNFGGETGDALWTSAPKVHVGPPPAWVPDPDLSGYEGEEGMSPEDIEARISSWWANNVNSFWLQSKFRAPSAAEVKAALESVPSIGAGNVEVEKLAPENAGKEDQKSLRYHPYKVTFTGDLANQSVEAIGSKAFSFIPQLDLASLIPSDDGGDGEPSEPKTPIPGGTDEDGNPVPDLPPPAGPIAGDPGAYLEYLNFKAGTQFQNGDFEGYRETVDLLLKVLGENVLDLIDIGAATALLGRIIIPPPDSVEDVRGEDPIPAETQELCSQGIVTLTSVAGETENPGTTDGNDPSVQGGTENRGGAGVSVAG
jgi:hypothetical protein